MRISDWSSDVCSSDLRYNVSREYQDQYSLQSQQRTAAAQAAGAFDDEIVPVEATMAVKDKATGEIVKRSRSEEHTSELQSLMRISYAVFCLKKKTKTNPPSNHKNNNNVKNHNTHSIKKQKHTYRK